MCYVIDLNQGNNLDYSEFNLHSHYEPTCYSVICELSLLTFFQFFTLDKYQNPNCPKVMPKMMTPQTHPFMDISKNMISNLIEQVMRQAIVSLIRVPVSTRSLRKLKDTEKNATMKLSMTPRAKPPSDSDRQLNQTQITN